MVTMLVRAREVINRDELEAVVLKSPKMPLWNGTHPSSGRRWP